MTLSALLESLRSYLETATPTNRAGVGDDFHVIVDLPQNNRMAGTRAVCIWAVPSFFPPEMVACGMRETTITITNARPDAPGALGQTLDDSDTLLDAAELWAGANSVQLTSDGAGSIDSTDGGFLATRTITARWSR